MRPDRGGYFWKALAPVTRGRSAAHNESHGHRLRDFLFGGANRPGPVGDVLDAFFVGQQGHRRASSSGLLTFRGSAPSVNTWSRTADTSSYSWGAFSWISDCQAPGLGNVIGLYLFPLIRTLLIRTLHASRPGRRKRPLPRWAAFGRARPCSVRTRGRPSEPWTRRRDGPRFAAPGGGPPGPSLVNPQRMESAGTPDRLYRPRKLALQEGLPGLLHRSFPGIVVHDRRRAGGCGLHQHIELREGPPGPAAARGRAAFAPCSRPGPVSGCRW